MDIDIADITILAIDTSADETSASVVRGLRVLSNARYSQISEHGQFGGIVPGTAKFLHADKIDGIVDEALEDAGISKYDLQAIAVTQGPGLAIALEVGVNKAKELARELNIPLVGVNHMEGHLVSALAGGESKVEFPAVGVLVSGGHTEFVLVRGIGDYEKVGITMDDAAGEAFDKCARMLGLPYPGGPAISKLAEQYQDSLDIKVEQQQSKKYVRGYQEGELKYELPVPMSHSRDANMSYSGLKTAFKKLVQESGGVAAFTPGEIGESPLSEDVVGELCLMFEITALTALVMKLEIVIKQHQVREIWLGGGVTANKRLRSEIEQLSAKQGVVLRVPTDVNLMLDNAAMIGLAAGLRLARLPESEWTVENGIYTAENMDQLDRDPGLSL